MSPDRPDVVALLAAVNPVPHDPGTDRTLDMRARADLAAILTSLRDEESSHAQGPPLSTKRHWCRRAVVAGAVAVVTAGVLGAGMMGRAPWAGPDTARAATPAALTYRPVPGGADAPTMLRTLAAQVRQLPRDDGHGRYANVTVREWSLWTRVDGRQVTSEVVPLERRSWIADDGSGRLSTTVLRPGASPRTTTEVYGPGGLSMMWPAGSLSGDPRTLAEQLGRGHPAGNGPAERLVAIEDAYQAMPLGPSVRAALLRYLADTPGLLLTGQVSDRVGRPGLAVSIDSDYSGLPTRYTLIVDTTTGALIDSEETLTSSAGKLNVTIPAVISYTVFLGSRYTSRTE